MCDIAPFIRTISLWTVLDYGPYSLNKHCGTKFLHFFTIWH